MPNNLDIDILTRILREAETRTVSGAFEHLIDKEINIPKGTREMASDSQKHLREFLSTECDRDITFPQVLSIQDSDFLGGSFARHVKNWPLDDIDVFLPLDGYNLLYLQNGLRLPYTVLSDGVLSRNPLLTTRWMVGPSISSVKLINEFAAVLRRHYPDETEVVPDGQAVSVRMKQGETQSGDGLGYDVVPCFSLKPDNSSELPFYLIPDGADGWIRTNPRYDQKVSDHLHKKNNKTFRKVVKLLKFWNTERLGGVLSSYYIELTIARVFLGMNENNVIIDPVSFWVALGLWALNQAVEQGNQASWIAGAPPVPAGDLTLAQKQLLLIAKMGAHGAWDHERAGDQATAIQEWRKVFGPKFPESV